MKYIVDIDNTICNTDGSNYQHAKPYKDRINHFNTLFDNGHEIVYYTARGGHSGKDWSEFTILQLEEWHAKYTSLYTDKPSYDIWIDDKSINSTDYFLTLQM